ncbi:MAG: NRDE family protein [Marinobacter sp.]|nr:NRDE family protein [Marinobacter sp.]
MCLILFALDQHPHFPLVVAANRDEFFARPTAPMHWWPDRPVLAGKDLASGGTWLALASNGEVSAVTNVRQGGQDTSQRSRGELPLTALQGAAGWRQQLLTNRDTYAGFNLIHLDTHQGWHLSNRDAHPGRHIHRGYYGVSNHLLQSPWPKLVRLRQQLRDLLAVTARTGAAALHQQLLLALQDQTPAPDHLLPDTGVGLTMERWLSSPFVLGAHYGTRASTVITVAHSGEITVTEQTWHPEGVAGQLQQFQWQSGQPPGAVV